jgi:hypothetical protein
VVKPTWRLRHWFAQALETRLRSAQRVTMDVKLVSLAR